MTREGHDNEFVQVYNLRGASQDDELRNNGCAVDKSDVESTK